MNIADVFSSSQIAIFFLLLYKALNILIYLQFFFIVFCMATKDIVTHMYISLNVLTCPENLFNFYLKFHLPVLDKLSQDCR